MRGIDYKSLYEDLVMKLDAIEEKVLEMAEGRLTDDEFQGLSEMIGDAMSGTNQEFMEEMGIDRVYAEKARTDLDETEDK